jgi:DNA-binding NtrC family response regulator
MAANAEIHAQVLLVDDDRGHAETMAEALKKPGHVCTIRHSRAEAEDELRHGAFDVIVTDLVMEGPTAGLEVLELAKRLQPDAETIMVTAHGDIPTAKKALQGGAYDFIECSGTRTAGSRASWMPPTGSRGSSATARPCARWSPWSGR